MTERLPGLPGITIADVKQAMDEETRRRGAGERDRRICCCGHPVARHQTLRGVSVCQPSRMSCGCRDLVPVLLVEDTRVFLRKTTGIGVRHALVKGAVSALEGEQKIEWLGSTVCERCGDDEAVPTGLRRTAGGGVIVAETSPESTRFLCERCRGLL